MRCPEKVSTCQQAFGPILRQSPSVRLSQADGQTCGLMLRASPLRGIAPSRYGVGSSACPALFLRPHAHHRPHVSISWALPQTLASCGILPNTPCGWHLLTTTRESTCRVTPFPVPMVASVGRCSPPGFCGSANRSVSKAAGALSCAVLAPACQPLALVGLHDGSLHLCLRCP